MNTKLGYNKLLLDNNNVLLSGGGDKPLSDFIGYLQFASNKIQYKKFGDTNWTDLATIPTKSSWNYNDVYVSAIGVGTGDHANQLYYTLNGSNTYIDVPYASASATATKATYDSHGTYLNGIPVVIGTQTAKTGSWTGSLVGTGITALYTGLTIRYYLPYAPNSNASLNLTLDDANHTTTGAIACYYSLATRLTTHYGVGSVITLTYFAAGSISNAGTPTSTNCWIADANYDSGNTDTLLRVYRQTSGYNADYPILVSRSTGIGTAGTNDSYTAVYGVIFDSNYPTCNPSTGEVKVAKLSIFNGESTSFLKADGSLDSNSYLTSTDIPSWVGSTKPSYAFSEITGSATASQVPNIENLTNFGSKVYDASAKRSPHHVLAGPSNGTATAAATFRALVAADIPTLDYLSLTNGGTVQAATTFQGNVTAVEFYATSDLRKKNIKDILLYNYKDFAQIQLVEFEWKDKPDEKHLGVIAQDVLKYIPELVQDKDDSLSVDYATLGTLSGIAACKEIEKLKDTVKMLQDEIKMLKNG